MLREIQQNRQLLQDLKQENASLKTLVRELEQKINSIPQQTHRSTGPDRVFHKRDEMLLRQIVSEAMDSFTARVDKELQEINMSVQNVKTSVHDKVQALLEDKNRLTWEEHKQRQMDILNLNQQMFASGQRFHADLSSMYFINHQLW